VWTKPYFKVKILRLKCNKFDFCWGSAPDPLVGPTSKCRREKGEGKEEGKGREKERSRGCYQVLRGM